MKCAYCTNDANLSAPEVAAISFKKMRKYKLLVNPNIQYELLIYYVNNIYICRWRISEQDIKGSLI